MIVMSAFGICSVAIKAYRLTDLGFLQGASVFEPFYYRGHWAAALKTLD